MEPSNQESIRHLLDDLCKSLYRDSTQQKDAIAHRNQQMYIGFTQQTHATTIPNHLLRACRRNSYEILLKKTHKRSWPADLLATDEGFSENIDPLRELKYCQFVHNIHVGQMQPLLDGFSLLSERDKRKILAKSEMFNECVKTAETDNYFCQEHSDGYAILQFLVLLKNSASDEEIAQHIAGGADESIFALNTQAMPIFPEIKPIYFQLNWSPQEDLLNNPYCSSMQKLNSFSKLFQSNGSLQTFQSRAQLTAKSSSEQKRSKSHDKKRPPPLLHYTANKCEYAGLRIPLDGSAETSALLEALVEKKFLTETVDGSMNAAAFMEMRNGEVFVSCVMTEKLLIEHIKLLLIGIESESFAYDHSTMTFQMLEQLTTNNVLPVTVSRFVADSVECGTCYKRLKIIIERSTEKSKQFLFKALQKCLDRYLEKYRRAIILEEAETICELSIRISPSIKQIWALAKLLTIHPNDENNEILYGSEFLGYLYRQIIDVTQQEISIMLILILSDCCDVYFRHFANWIFKGIIDDHGRELFIQSMDYYVSKTKFFFDKGFIIKRQSVPGFLQGWENSILLCGKYSNLLKLYNPMHPLFSITPPKIAVCLSFSQLGAVEDECEKYRQSAEAICGVAFSIFAWKKRQHDQQIELRQSIVENLQKNHEKWEAQQEAKVVKWQENRERNRLQLLEQMEEINERKLQRKREELEIDEKYLKHCEQHELKLLERENEQRRKNIEHYSELASIVDAQQKRAEEEINEMKSQLATKEIENVPNDDNFSGDDSEYFEAEKIPSNPTKNENPAVGMPRSISDILNSNVEAADDLSLDRARNRMNVLSSNINLATFDETNAQQVAVPLTELSELQKNKLKVMQQEYAWLDANANTDDGKLAASPIFTELTALQKNRQKVLSSEFGISDVLVNVAVPAITDKSSELDRNKYQAQSHSHTFNQPGDLNANQPINALEQNRANQEDLASSMKSNETAAARNKLKASLSLELDNSKSNKAKEMTIKPCQSDFNLSPMSTSSDPITINHPENDAIEETDYPLKTPTSEQLQLTEKATSLFNTATQNTTPSTPALPFFLQILQPSFTATNIFDISPRSTLPPPTPTTAQTPYYQSLKSLSESDIQNLNVANLTYFLQQSFVIPFQIHFTILNNEILKIFYEDLDVMSLFNSLRNYFFMMDGEFALNISDGLISKLHSVKRPSELLNSHALHTILENALQSTVMRNNKNAMNLSFCIPNVPEQFDLASPNVLADLHLSYKIEWPLNLVVSDDAVKQYDVVFQYLLKLRRITWLLEQCFYKSKEIRHQSAGKILQSPQFRHVQQIRHKLVCFVSALQSHLTSVIQASWQKFQNDLVSVKSMEDLYKKHTKYLKRVKFLCMLNRSSRDIYDRMEDVFVLILRFCYNLQGKAWRCNDHGIYTHQKYEKLQQVEADFTNQIKFIIYAGTKMFSRGYQVEINEFIHMININGYYNDA